MSNTHKYDDIIHLSRPVSDRRAQMNMATRAAQFSPFAALVGYDAAIAETARLTDFRMELTESAKAALNDRLREIAEAVKSCPEVRATYFIPDERKSGGAYVTVKGRFLRVDPLEQLLMLEGQTIPLARLVQVE